MSRELTAVESLERSLLKRFRKELWKPFIVAVQRYELLPDGAVIAVPLDGYAPSALTAKLLQELARHTAHPFNVSFFWADGAPQDESLAASLGLTISNPPSNDAWLVSCECMEDVAEDTLAAMLHDGVLRGTLPRERREDGSTVIRPLIRISREDIHAWVRYNGLTFPAEPEPDTDILQAKALLAELEAETPDVIANVFAATHNLALGTMPGYDSQGTHHSFLEAYNQNAESD